MKTDYLTFNIFYKMKKIQIQNSIALVSGANRGIGKAITEELLNKGVKKVYAGARKKESLN